MDNAAPIPVAVSERSQSRRMNRPPELRPEGGASDGPSATSTSRAKVNVGFSTAIASRAARDRCPSTRSSETLRSKSPGKMPAECADDPVVTSRTVASGLRETPADKMEACCPMYTSMVCRWMVGAADDGGEWAADFGFAETGLPPSSTFPTADWVPNMIMSASRMCHMSTTSALPTQGRSRAQPAANAATVEKLDDDEAIGNQGGFPAGLVRSDHIMAAESATEMRASRSAREFRLPIPDVFNVMTGISHGISSRISHCPHFQKKTLP